MTSATTDTTDVLGYARGSSDYREVLADPEVDLVQYLVGPVADVWASAEYLRSVLGGTR